MGELVELPSSCKLVTVRGALVDILLGVGGNTHVYLYSGDQCDSVGLLLEGAVADTKGSDSVNVNCNGHDLYLAQVEGL